MEAGTQGNPEQRRVPLPSPSRSGEGLEGKAKKKASQPGLVSPSVDTLHLFHPSSLSITLEAHHLQLVRVGEGTFGNLKAVDWKFSF